MFDSCDICLCYRNISNLFFSYSPLIFQTVFKWRGDLVHLAEEICYLLDLSLMCKEIVLAIKLKIALYYVLTSIILCQRRKCSKKTAYNKLYDDTNKATWL